MCVVATTAELTTSLYIYTLDIHELSITREITFKTQKYFKINFQIKCFKSLKVVSYS